MAVTVISTIKQQNRSNTIGTSDFFLLLDSSDINFRIQGIQENDTFDPGTTADYRYIVKNVNALHPGFTGTTANWGNNDIVYYIPPLAGVSGYYEILLDASNKQSGTIVFNEGDSKFYGFDGTDWLELGAGAVGITGSQGFQGFQGNIGITGTQGFQGFQGNIGITGTQGFQGFQGNIGITGTQGFQGFQGFQGNIGITGTQGFQGFQGNIGITGTQGFQGFQGNIGITGTQGFQGFQGNIGITGTQGFQGFQGLIGVTGVQGFQGFQGNIGITGTQGFQGFQGNIGVTGVQGFQGFQGLIGVTGVQGFQGNIGITGTQGFQGRQGFQGFQGSKGSGKYFYGPTAPELTDDGLTLGSKWFNTEIGAEFTYIIEEDSTTQWVMVNVFSATGPQGPLGGGTGNQGFQGNIGITGTQGFQGFQGNIGITGTQGFQGFQGLIGITGVQGFQGFQGNIGITGVQGFQGRQGFQGFQGNIGITGVQGFQGFQGLKGSTGDGLFDTTYATGTEKSNTINYSTLGSVSGSARKIPVLLDDGSITFDYMRTSDLVPLFAITSFKFDTSNSPKVYLIGSGTLDLSGKNVQFSYIPTDEIISSSVVNLVTSLGNTGFPLDMSGNTSANFPTGSGISYPNSFATNGIATARISLSVTASDNSNKTSDFDIQFKQNNYYGVTSSSSVDGEDLDLFTGYLDNNFVTNFTVSAGAGQFIYFAHPTRYGDDAVFQFGTNVVDFERVDGGNGSTHTNANGYVEKYYIYKSNQSNLGSGVNITVS